MARQITEMWMGVGFSVEQGKQQRQTPEGLPLMAPDGSPETEDVTILVFVDNTPFGQHVIRVPFNEEGRAKLLKALSGGIVIANGKLGDLRGLPPL